MSENKTTSVPAYPEAIVNFNDAMRYAESRGSYEIKKVILNSPGAEPREVYLVALRGTNRSFDKDDVLGVWVCLQSFLSKSNIYFELVKEAINRFVPKGEEIVLIGHSLGGMICQQISADSELNRDYKFINLLNIGSPYVKVSGRTCPFHRFADRADFIPWLGRSIVANLVTEKPVFKCNGYFGKPVAAHTDSYRLSESWSCYDSFGVLNGGNTMTFVD